MWAKKIDPKLLLEFTGLATIIQDALFDRYSIKWFLDFILRDLFRINPFINQLVKKNDLKAFSHSFLYGKDLKCKIINWIPDFQHLRLPGMFSKTNFLVRNYRLKALSRFSDVIILSSFDALNDFKLFTPQYSSKASVIHFVSQTTTVNGKPINYLQDKYTFKNNFFFLPNQFWAHKNHKIVFEAIQLVKQKLPHVLLICSGQLDDNRNPKNIGFLKQYISDNSLQSNIKLLGLVPFDDVLLLMHHSISVINPSIFEGWSSTLEEAKSMNKNLILSDIAVHKEQAPALKSFFDPKNAKQLASLLFENSNNVNLNSSQNIYNIDNLILRTATFAKQYESLLFNQVG